MVGDVVGLGDNVVGVSIVQLPSVQFKFIISHAAVVSQIIVHTSPLLQ